MAKARGKYASPAQAERRKRILRETLKLLASESPSDISMAQIAELSDVSTKTLYNLFKSRNGLLLAAAAQTRADTQSSTSVMSAPAGTTHSDDRLTENILQNLQGSVILPGTDCMQLSQRHKNNHKMAKVPYGRVETRKYDLRMITRSG